MPYIHANRGIFPVFDMGHPENFHFWRRCIQHFSVGRQLYAAKCSALRWRRRFTMTVSIVSMWNCRVVPSYLFVLHMHMGLPGVWQ